MPTNLIDSILALTAIGLRLYAGIKKSAGLVKLASEIELMASDIDAFRKTPVYHEELEKIRHSHTW